MSGVSRMAILSRERFCIETGLPLLGERLGILTLAPR